MNRRMLFVFATWAATAGTAVAAGAVAITVLGEGITDRAGQPMTSADVQRALAQPYQSPSAASSPLSSVSPPVAAGPAPRTTAPQAGGVTRGLASAGGDVIARCDHGSAYLISWTPAQGYGTGYAGRGPADRVTVRFQGGGRQVTMVIVCRDGQPVLDGGPAAPGGTRDGVQDDQVTVPNVVGQTYDRAVAALKAAGLRAKRHGRPFSGPVTGQDPQGGRAARGSVVKIWG
ncbi:PASTA domain-containing protein [Actinomadura scrupuli]|uniref:PASTA domain-containing protein n=1 Tax=Actinomadura scrupuli TaxID=559629 RepID=UPI003D965920